MSIEDVDYLLSNSEDNSLVIFSDSKNRDYTAYPQPNSYVVDFDHPIRNVYGIEILDATIPATAYTVDTNTCSIAFTQVFYAPGTGISDASNPTTFAANIEVLQYCPAFDAIFSAPSIANMFICTNLDNYNSISFQDPGVTTMHAAFYVRQVPIGGQYTITLTSGQEINIDDEYVVNAINANNSYTYAINENFVIHIEYKYTATLSDITTLLDSFVTTPMYDLYLAQNYQNLPIGSYTSDILLTFMLPIYQAGSNQYIKYMQTNVLTSLSIDIVPIFSDNPSAGSSSITQKFSWSTSCKYPFIFDMGKSSASSILGFSEPINTYAASHTYSALAAKLTDISPDETSSFGYTTFTYAGNTKLYMSLRTTPTSQKLIAPGVVNIEAARYIILRCPEIESHMLGSYANFKYAPGVGLFKLTSSNSMMNLRFDFVNIIRKPFHPIGKLSKLTLTFENPNGTLYDFKGVDHVLLISIKYYAPKNITRIPISSLNPYYLPNILEYQIKQYNDKSLKHTLKSKYAIEDVIREQKQFMS